MMTIHKMMLKTHLLLTTHVRSVHSGHSREKFQNGAAPVLYECAQEERKTGALDLRLDPANGARAAILRDVAGLVEQLFGVLVLGRDAARGARLELDIALRIREGVFGARSRRRLGGF
jgi:hypothetical protein